MLVLLLASRSEDQFDCTTPLNITSKELADGSCYGCPTRNTVLQVTGNVKIMCTNMQYYNLQINTDSRMYLAFQGTDTSDIVFGPGNVVYTVNNTEQQTNISVNQGTNIEFIEELTDLNGSFHIMYYQSEYNESTAAIGNLSVKTIEIGGIQLKVKYI